MIDSDNRRTRLLSRESNNRKATIGGNMVRRVLVCALISIMATIGAEASLDIEANAAMSSELAMLVEENERHLETEAKAVERVSARISVGLTGIDEPLVTKYREQYLRPANVRWLSRVLEDGARYRPYIRAQLAERGMPFFLEYLPLVESEYCITAKSKSGALGLWQFMENSMASLLYKDYYIDERLDPYKSTDAALTKLKDNYNTFGDWELALVAYNCGAGALSKVIKSTGISDFWYLANNGLLKAESTQYVPKLIALTDIIINSEYYGIELPELDEGTYMVDDYDYVTLASSNSLRVLSIIGGIDEAELMRLNPELYRKRTPKDAYRLRLPSGTKEDFVATVQATGGRTLKGGAVEPGRVYTVQKGDTLWGISRRYGLTVDDICVINGIKATKSLSIGQELIVK